MPAEPVLPTFEELYAAGVTFEPEAIAREHAAHGGPWRELAPRTAPAEPIALGGELITPDGARDGWIVVADGTIAQIGAAQPEGVRALPTHGVILPGLLDLHNHPEFNVFAEWEPPRQFGNRYEWRASPVYRQLVRDPQNELLKKVPLRTETRYAEIRALVGGVTAIQGASGRDQSREEALVRNVDLQVFGRRRAQALIDLPSEERPEGMERLRRVLDSIVAGEVTAFYLHLCEGRPGDARLAEEWVRFVEVGALTPATIVIHGTSLTTDGLSQLRDGHAKLVWSPQSNLRLYGQTTRAADALRLGLPVALGADWMPSGSPSLLAEMKVARRELANQGLEISARKLVEMVTCDAANIAGLGDELGTLAERRPADLVVMERRSADSAWENVAQALPDWVELVMIGGDLAYGRADWMTELAPAHRREALEPVIAWGKRMLLDSSFTARPADGPLPTLAELRAALIAHYPQTGPIFA